MYTRHLFLMKSESDNHMNKHKILWADDDLDDLLLVREILHETEHNFEIVEVHNGQQALDYLNKASKKNDFPCLIILDMNMPVLNGKDTLVILKNEAAYKDIPVVIFTTSNSEMDRLFCKKYGVEMITKPPEYTTLATSIRKLLSFCNLHKKSK